jgi:glycosyltransferase involved in cell wall biosynthesis
VVASTFPSFESESQTGGRALKLLVFILSYNAERHIESVFDDIPPLYRNSPDTQILLIDDASEDMTVEVARAYVARNGLTNVRVFKNAINQGYGGNQKVGYTYAIREGFDVVVMLHGDNQYTPKALPDLLEPFRSDPDLGCVLGVRFGQRYSPLRGGMPLYKYVGNRILTTIQNKLASIQLSEWHTGYRAYATRALSNIGFALNTNDFHFDTEILLQLIKSGAKFAEVNIPTHYGDEICRVNGVRYAKDVLKATFRFMLQKYHLFYDVRFHPEVVLNKATDESTQAVYGPKTQPRSAHLLVCHPESNFVPLGAEVLDIGCSSGYVAAELTRHRQCRVTGVDVLAPSKVSGLLHRYEQMDVERDAERLAALMREGTFDVVLMLDIIERLSVPERFLLQLSALPKKKAPRFVFSTPNVAFVVVRLMLLFGHFNYGQRGILDVTHKRLFSLHTFRNLIEQTGFIVQREVFMPFPFRALGFSARISRVFDKVNRLLIRLRPRLFAYQVVLEARPLMTPGATLAETIKSESTATYGGSIPR